MKKNNIVAVLDLGSTKAVAVIAQIENNGEVTVLGFSERLCYGLHKGMVANIDLTAETIEEVIEEAQHLAGIKVNQLRVSISGSNLRSFNSQGIVAVSGSEVSQADVDKVLEATQAVAIPADYKVLHVLPQEFAIDEHQKIQKPVGMSGVRLEASAHIVTAPQGSLHNLNKCVNVCGLRIKEFVLAPLASSWATLSEDERNLGCCLIDIGGGTTSFTVFIGGSVRYYGLLPVGGEQVTNDLAVAMGAPTKTAEDIKIKYACAFSDLVKVEQYVVIPPVADHPQRRVSRLTIAKIVGPRYEEIFAIIKQELEENGLLDLLGSGFVLTGGASKTEGMLELAKQVFYGTAKADWPVRSGLPNAFKIKSKLSGMREILLDPSYSTALGLLSCKCGIGTSGLQPQSLIRGMYSKIRYLFKGKFSGVGG